MSNYHNLISDFKEGKLHIDEIMSAYSRKIIYDSQLDQLISEGRFDGVYEYIFENFNDDEITNMIIESGNTSLEELQYNNSSFKYELIKAYSKYNFK